MKKLVSFLLAVLILFSVAYAETVVQEKMKLSIRNTTLSGVYTGDIKKGLPEGFGLFETRTPDGTSCHYIGQWKKGLMHGQGAMYWNDGSLEIGEYSKGQFVTGKYNYNGLKLLVAKADDEETLNPYWLVTTTKASMSDDSDTPTVKYIGNKSSHIFHRLTCDSVRTMKEKNKIELYSREEAIEKHYKPCGRCNP